MDQKTIDVEVKVYHGSACPGTSRHEPDAWYFAPSKWDPTSSPFSRPIDTEEQAIAEAKAWGERFNLSRL